MTQICGSDDIVQKPNDFLQDADDIVQKPDDFLRDEDDIVQEADDFLQDSDDIAQDSNKVFESLVFCTPFHQTLNYTVRDRPIWDQKSIVQLLRH